MRLVVVGTSAGGMEALKILVSRLPPDFPACVLIVRHLSPEASAGHLARALDSAGPLKCTEAKDADPLVPGHIYLAPADRHLLVDDHKLWVTTGPRENRWRPSVDVLFRSAAVAHRERVIGIILTGYLDDGAQGLSAVKRCGGICIVQDPADARYPEMPSSALKRVRVDFSCKLEAIGDILREVLARKVSGTRDAPDDLVVENRIAVRAGAGISRMDEIGSRSPYSCPECGGIMWEIGEGGLLRYRCHTGHSFSSEALDGAQARKLEETLWAALRLLEERKSLLQKLAATPGGRRRLLDRIEEASVHIERLREVLLGGSPGAPS